MSDEDDKLLAESKNSVPLRRVGTSYVATFRKEILEPIFKVKIPREILFDIKTFRGKDGKLYVNFELRR